MRFISLLLIGLALCACTKVGQGTATGRHPWTIPGVVRIGSTGEPDNLNLMFAHDAAADEIQNLLLAPVFRLNEKGEPTPELGLDVPTTENGLISKDGKTLTVHFRTNVVWADGEPLTARDFRFTWRAVMDNRNNTKTRAGWDDIKSIDLPDDYTAVIHLKETYAPFIVGVLGSAAYPPLPEHLLGKLPDLNRASFNSAPLSSGPWILQKWNHEASLEFEPNPKYWRGPPKLKHLSWKVIPSTDTLFSQLQTHEIDVYPGVAENQIDRLSAIEGIVVTKTLLADERHLEINTRRPALREVAVRLAIAQAVDWDRINTKIYHGYNYRAVSDILPTSWAAPTIPQYKHDPAGAKAMLDAAGWKVGSNGVRAKNGVALNISVSSSVNNHPNEQAEVQMQQDLKAIGIALEIKNYPVSLLFAQNGPLYTGKYDMSWTINTFGPDPDNQGNWSADFIPPKGANTSFLADPILTRTSAEALRTFDRAKRKALYQIEEEEIHKQVPAVFLYWHYTRHGINSDLKNYKPAQYIADNWNSWEWEI